jgi:uncharacterized protein YbaP (TraB family)
MFSYYHKRSLGLGAAWAILSIVLIALSDGATAGQSKCCVWKVTNAKAPFYLVGSVHALSSRDYPLPPPYEIALKDSKRLLFEFNPNLGDEFAKKFEAAGKYPPGQDVTTRLHPKALAWMRQHLQTVKLQYNKAKKNYDVFLGSFDQSKQYRAWYLAENYIGIPNYTSISYKYGVDNYLAKKARQAGKEIGGLESVDAHVAVLGGLSDSDGQIVLLDTIVYSQQDAAGFGRIRSAWRRGDTEKLWGSDARLRKEAFWIAQRLVDNRNTKWIPRIEAEIKSGKPTTIVAGALHFAGPNSVVTLLQKRGYTVEQL